MGSLSLSLSAAQSLFLPAASKTKPAPLPSFSFSFPARPAVGSAFAVFTFHLTKPRSPITPLVAAPASAFDDLSDAGELPEQEMEDEEEQEEVGGEDEGGVYQEPPEEAKLYVGNLPYDMDSEKLAQLFDQAGIVEIAEVIYNRETDQSRGFGFVTMQTVEEAEKAVNMFHRYEVNGRLLTVNKAAPRGARVERPRESGPSFRIYVGNLPWQVSDSRLMQVFSEHGKVVDARVVTERETGRSRGFGFVTMESKEEMDDAIAALDGHTLDGRALRVNAAEDKPSRSF